MCLVESLETKVCFVLQVSVLSSYRCFFFNSKNTAINQMILANLYSRVVIPKCMFMAVKSFLHQSSYYRMKLWPRTSFGLSSTFTLSASYPQLFDYILLKSLSSDFPLVTFELRVCRKYLFYLHSGCVPLQFPFVRQTLMLECLSLWPSSQEKITISPNQYLLPIFLPFAGVPGSPQWRRTGNL